MYLSHNNLKRKPFQISTDPEFLWMGEKHKEALAILKYGILDNRGFLLLTGDVGTGKTTLIHALVNSLGENTLVAMLPDPDLELFDFLRYIANSLNMDQSFQSKGEFLIKFRRFLIDKYKNGKKVLLIIDEAQRLNHEQLDEIRVLSNIEAQNTKLLNIFFVGQDEFNDILLENKNRALRQRITINYNIDPLTNSETEAYVRYRLKTAGSRESFFDIDAFHEIHLFSKGYPRLVNIICDHAMLTGYVRGIRQITSDIIEECALELQIQPSQNQKAQSEVKEKQSPKVGHSMGTAVLQPDFSEQAMEPAINASLTLNSDHSGTMGQLLALIENLSEDKQTELLSILKKWESEDKREFKRKSCLVPIDYSSSDRAFRDFVQNLSIGGVFIETRESFSVGQAITLLLNMPDSQDHFKVSGEIVRAEPLGIAVKFKKVTRYQAEMVKFITDRL